MKVAYRRASRHMGLLVGYFVIGNVVGIGAAWLLERRLGGLSFVITVAIIIGFLAAGYLVSARKDKRRRAEIGKLLTGRGFALETTPSVHSFGPFASLIE